MTSDIKYEKFQRLLTPLKEAQKRKPQDIQNALNVNIDCMNEILAPDQISQKGSDTISFIFNMERTSLKSNVCREYIPNLIDMILHFGIMPNCVKCDEPSFDEPFLAESDNNVYFTCSDECRKSIKWYYDQLKIGPNCPICFAPGCTLMCAQCQIQKYCSRDCQVRHWKTTHKKECHTDPLKLNGSSKTSDI